jgi:hypothetical protein
VSSATRSIVVNALDEGTYYRAFIATPIFAFALAAETVVDLNGNNLKTDSFDSADPVKSFFGNYDPSKAQAGGNIGAYRGLILEMRASGGA